MNGRTYPGWQSHAFTKFKGTAEAVPLSKTSLFGNYWTMSVTLAEADFVDALSVPVTVRT